jgi:hypothetical protein
MGEMRRPISGMLLSGMLLSGMLRKGRSPRIPRHPPQPQPTSAHHRRGTLWGGLIGSLDGNLGC